MTAWTQIDILQSDEPAAEFVLAFAGKDGPIPERDQPRLSLAIRHTGFAAQPGQWLDVPPAKDTDARIILIGAPEIGTATPHDWASLGGNIVEAMGALRLETARLSGGAALADDARLSAILLGVLLHGFRPDTGRRHPDPTPWPQRLLIPPGREGARDQALRTARAVNRARAWVEAPANRLTPQAWAAELPAIFEPLGATLRIFDSAALQEMGASALLAVGRASEFPPLLAVVEWRGAPAREGWDAVLVGKGMTFDSGGLNLKTAAPVIARMGFDMGGGAAVLGAVELAASRKAGCNVAAIVPMAENAVDGKSFRPGDVIQSLGGLTIEIRNTDGEGRLVLADGIAYGLKTYQPAHVVDIATLTGMIAVALLEEFAGLYANNDALAAELDEAGRATGELVWRMPCQPNQDHVVETPVADVANMSTFPGLLGTGLSAPVSGAKLLQKFVGDTPWAHIDIAGTVWATRRSAYGGNNATGYGVRLLDQWLRRFERG